MPELPPLNLIPPTSGVSLSDKDLSNLHSPTSSSSLLSPSSTSSASSTASSLSPGFEQLLDLTASAAARYADYLLVHERSFRLIQQVTEFHTAICQAREALRKKNLKEEEDWTVGGVEESKGKEEGGEEKSVEDEVVGEEDKKEGEDGIVVGGVEGVSTVAEEISAPSVGVDKVGSAAEESTTVEPATAEPSIEESSTAESSTAESATVEPATVEPAAVGPATAEPSIGESSTEESSTAEPATVEPATVEPATVEPATVEPATVEPATAEPATAEPSIEESSTADSATGEPATVTVESDPEPATNSESCDEDLERETTSSELAALREIEEDKEFLESDYILSRVGIRKFAKELTEWQNGKEDNKDDMTLLFDFDPESNATDEIETEEVTTACKLKCEQDVKNSKTASSDEYLEPLLKMLEELEAVVHEILPQIKPIITNPNSDEDGDKTSNDDDNAKEEDQSTGLLPAKEGDNSNSKANEGTDASNEKEPVGLETHIRQGLEKHKSLQARITESPSLAEEIVNTIVGKCESIHTVAEIHLMRVARTFTIEGAQEVLRALPSGATDTYASVLREIEAQEPEHRDLARRVLMWLTFPLRPLTTAEFHHVITPQPATHPRSRPTIEEYTNRINRVCGGLVRIGDSAEMAVTYAHSTVKDYLLSSCQAFFSDVHFSMALDCMEYLKQPELEKGCTELLSSRKDSYQFLLYASQNWARHSRRVNPENTGMMKKNVIKFLGCAGSVSSAIQAIQGAVWPDSWATSLRVMSHFRSQAKKRILAAAFFKLNFLAMTEVEVRGSEVANLKDNQRQSLLSIAAMMDNLPLVKMLLNRDDVEADSKDLAERTPLLWAAASGARTELLKLLLDRSDVNPNPKNSIGQTALSWAAGGGHTHAVELLLAKGSEVDPNNKEVNGGTPLSLAAKGGHLEVVRRLLAHPDIDAELKAGYGRNALGWAAMQGHHEVVRLLLEKGVAFETIDDSGSTPLTLAAKEGHLETVRLLLGQDGINADLPEQDGATALSLAAQGDHAEIAKLLLARADVNPDSKDSFDRTPLKWACRDECVEVARLLLAIDKVDPNSRDRAWGGYTPLHSAADRGNVAIVKLLLERPDIQPDLPDDRANTPLLEAIWRGNTEVVDLLLSRKDVDPDKKGDGERTPLMLAASRGWIESFKLILKRAPGEVDINAVDNSRQNALYHASFHGYEDMVGLLLAQPNVDVNNLDNVGDTALGIAVEYCYSAVVKLFLARDDVDPDLPYGRSLRTPLGWASYVSNLEIVNLLLDTGRVNVNHQDSDGGSPLLLTIRNLGDDEIRKRLLECEGIDVTLRDNEGRTALSYAAQMGCVEAVQTFVDPEKPWAGKMDLDERDNFQRTPLWWAANSYRKDVVQYFLDTGKVSLDAQDTHGTTPLCIAAWHGCAEIVQLLLACDGVNPAIKDNDGDTVLLCAAGAGREDIVKILLNHPLADPEERNNLGRTAFACAANAGYVEVLPVLLEYRGPHPQIHPDTRYVDPDSRSNDGQTPLSLAAFLGRLDVVEFLLSLDDGKAVNPNSRCDTGRTPLSYAAENSRYDVVKLLLEKENVDYYIKDNDGHTPRWWAKREFTGSTSAVVVLGLFNRFKPGHP